MIELTGEQIESLKSPEDTPARIVNPQTKETFILLRADEYERLKSEEFDASPCTREELEALNWEVLDRLEREEKALAEKNGPRSSSNPTTMPTRSERSLLPKSRQI